MSAVQFGFCSGGVVVLFCMYICGIVLLYQPTPARSRGSASEKKCRSGTAAHASVCSWVLFPRFGGLPKLRVLGLKLPFSMGSESHVRDCGLWPGRMGGSFSWVLFTLSFSIGSESEAPHAGRETTFWVQKMLLENVVSHLEGAVDPSAGCYFPVSQGFRSSACWV